MNGGRRHKRLARCIPKSAVPTWDSDLYRRYEAERTRPAVDLAARVALTAPARVIDLGCGPGTSTEVLADRWPHANITGLDSSTTMLTAARAGHPLWEWIEGDIATWTADVPYDLVFSNAALQWVPDHGRAFPRLLDQVAPGGALAVQMPANFDAPAHKAMRDLAESSVWRNRFSASPREWFAHAPDFYYNVLAHAARLDIWTTEYLHVMDSVEAIVEWYRGTGLRPWLDGLPDDAGRERFLADYTAAIAPMFPPRADGKVLFPFKRLFVIAYR
jgi:trans-aconitate 2-methyltransferase